MAHSSLARSLTHGLVWFDAPMQLHAEVEGNGPRVALLLHGMTGSSESWWRVVPLLVARGFQVVALDLPGHGSSPRDPDASVERAGEAVAATVRAVVGDRVDLAMGHSFGGTVLAAAIVSGRLDADIAVFVDAPFTARGGWDRDTVRAEYEEDRRARTVVGLRAAKPWYSDRDCEVEARAAERFDPTTAAAFAAGPGGSWWPRAGSIVIRPDPSDVLSDEGVERLRASGVAVRDIPGARHAVWYSHFDAFVAALPEAFG